MSNTQNSQYMPDYLVAPGDVLDDYLDSQGMTQTELATRTGLSKKTINEIIKAKAPISHETALRFERTLGRPAHFWNNLERQYQEDQIRLAEKERMKSYLEWLKRIPVNAMVNLGWIPRQTEKLFQLEAVLGFFGVASPEQWQAVWRDYQVAYRQTQRIETQDEPVFAWLRRGELEARKIMCASFDKVRFQEVLEEIRQLTRETPDVFESKLIDLAASAGVAVVFVPELPKTGVFGATRWLRGKAVIRAMTISGLHSSMKRGIFLNMVGRKSLSKAMAWTGKKRKKLIFLLETN